MILFQNLRDATDTTAAATCGTSEPVVRISSMPATESPQGVPSLLLTAREAAKTLRLSEKTLWSLTRPRGPIPAVRIGRSVRYSVAALEAWVASQVTLNGDHASSTH